MIQKEKVVHITYDDSYPKLLHDDIVISFDGAIGRVGIGLCGVYSSGLRKIVIHAKTISKGYIYFWANSIKTQNTIQEHATGTTILHAGSSIDYLEINPLPENDLNIELDVIFKSLLSNLKIIDSLNHLKTYLLHKYFS